MVAGDAEDEADAVARRPAASPRKACCAAGATSGSWPGGSTKPRRGSRPRSAGWASRSGGSGAGRSSPARGSRVRWRGRSGSSPRRAGPLRRRGRRGDRGRSGAGLRTPGAVRVAALEAPCPRRRAAGPGPGPARDPLAPGGVPGGRRGLASRVAGASIRFCNTVMCDQRLKLWNTMASRGANPFHLLVIRRYPLTMPVGTHPDSFAVHRHDAGIRRFQQIDAAQEGALAGTGRTKDRNHGAFGYGEGNTLQHFYAAEALVQVFDDQSRGRCGHNFFSKARGAVILRRDVKRISYAIATEMKRMIWRARGAARRSA